MNARFLAAILAVLFLCVPIGAAAVGQYPPSGDVTPTLLPVLLTPGATIALETQRLELVQEDGITLNGTMLLRNTGNTAQSFQVGFPASSSLNSYPKLMTQLAVDDTNLSVTENLRFSPPPDYNLYRHAPLPQADPMSDSVYRDQWHSLWMSDYWKSFQEVTPYIPSVLPIDQPLEGTLYALTATQDDAEVLISCNIKQTTLLIDLEDYLYFNIEGDNVSFEVRQLYYPDLESDANTCLFALYWRGAPPQVTMATSHTDDQSKPAYKLEQSSAPVTTLSKEIDKLLRIHDSPETQWEAPYAKELAYQMADLDYEDNAILELNSVGDDYRSLSTTIMRVVDITLQPSGTTQLSWQQSSISHGYDETIEKRKTLYYVVLERSPLHLWQQVGDTSIALNTSERAAHVTIDGVAVDGKWGQLHEQALQGVPNDALFVSWQQPTKSSFDLSLTLFLLGLAAVAYWPITLLIIALIIWLIWWWRKRRKVA